MPSESRVVPCGGKEGRRDGQTDGQTNGKTDMANLIVAFRNFATAPIKRKQGRQGKKKKTRGQIGKKHYRNIKYGECNQGKRSSRIPKTQIEKIEIRRDE